MEIPTFRARHEAAVFHPALSHTHTLTLTLSPVDG